MCMLGFQKEDEKMRQQKRNDGWMVGMVRCLIRVDPILIRMVNDQRRMFSGLSVSMLHKLMVYSPHFWQDGPFVHRLMLVSCDEAFSKAFYIYISWALILWARPNPRIKPGPIVSRVLMRVVVSDSPDSGIA